MSINANSDTAETERTDTDDGDTSAANAESTTTDAADTDAEGEQKSGGHQDEADIGTDDESVESAVVEDPEPVASSDSKDSEREQDIEAAEDGPDAENESTVAGPPTTFHTAIQGGTIRTVLTTLRAIVDEARIHIDEDGISVQAIDRANVAMDDLDLTAAFESYDASPGVIGVDLDRFADAVGMANADDLVQLSLDERTRKLLIHVDGLEVTMACINAKTIRAEPDSPEFDLPAEVTLSRDALDRGVKAAGMVSDHVTLRMDEATEQFLIEAEGDTDEVSLEIDSEDLDTVTVADAQAVFSLDYMNNLVRSIPTGMTVSITVGTDFPVSLAYEFADGDGHVHRMVAPRIQSD